MTYDMLQILAETGWSRSTLHRRIKAGEFPEPIDPNRRPLTWRQHEVDAALAEDWEPSANDRTIMDTWPDEYQDAFERAVDGCREQAAGHYEDEREEIKERVEQEMWQEERGACLAAVIADGYDDNDDLEALAYERFRLSSDGSEFDERYAEAADELEAAIEAKAQRLAHVEAIEAVKRKINAQRQAIA